MSRDAADWWGLDVRLFVIEMSSFLDKFYLWFLATWVFIRSPAALLTLRDATSWWISGISISVQETFPFFDYFFTRDLWLLIFFVSIPFINWGTLLANGSSISASMYKKREISQLFLTCDIVGYLPFFILPFDFTFYTLRNAARWWVKDVSLHVK
jgi:hypothetical protein